MPVPNRGVRAAQLTLGRACIVQLSRARTMARRWRNKHAMRWSIQRAACGDAAAVQHVRVDLCGFHAGVAQQLLHRSDVRASFEHMSGEAMAERVARGWLVYAGATKRFAHDTLDRLLVDMMSTPRA